MPPGFNLMLNLNKTGNFMQKSAIIVLYLKKNYTQLFFVLENFAAFKKNFTQQHSWYFYVIRQNGTGEKAFGATKTPKNTKMQQKMTLTIKLLLNCIPGSGWRWSHRPFCPPRAGWPASSPPARSPSYELGSSYRTSTDRTRCARMISWLINSQLKQDINPYNYPITSKITMIWSS